jgi:AraC-like DNA-binding protein
MNELITHFSGPMNETVHMDHRIINVLNSIHAKGSRTIGLEKLADEIGLSPSRLSHLFSKEMGLSIKQYLLWQKLNHAVFKIGAGRSMLEAATEAGFSDGSHFSRTFRNTFGMPPSQILRKKESVHIISDTDIDIS